MSGTAFGTIMLHVTPEAAVGGPLGLVRNGDRIKLSVSERRIDLLVKEAELVKRRAGASVSPLRFCRAISGVPNQWRSCCPGLMRKVGVDLKVI